MINQNKNAIENEGLNKNIDLCKGLKNTGKLSYIFGSALLISGTSIGAGMLGLPIQTAASGFWPSVLSFGVIWAIMTFTALLLVEVSFWLKGETHIASMASKSLGKNAGIIAWLVYVVFLYALLGAYTSGGSSLLIDVVKNSFNFDISYKFGTFLFTLPFAAMIFLGVGFTDKVNRLLLLGLCFSYCCILFYSLNNFDVNFSNEINLKYVPFSFPIIVTSFGFHHLVPSFKVYLKEDYRMVRKAILIGSFIPLIVYVVWEAIVMGIIPIWGDAGLVSMLQSSSNPAELIKIAISKNNPTLSFWVALFAFSALISSFVGVGLGLNDIFADGLKLNRKGLGKLISVFITFAPPILFTLYYPNGFISALNYAGFFGIILLIIYPVMMVYSGRYLTKIIEGDNLNQDVYRVFGGKFTLAIAFFFGIIVLLVEFLKQINYLKITLA